MPERETASDIDAAATMWAAKVDRGLASEEQTELDLWLAGDSRRLGAFVRAQAAWIHAERATALGEMPEGDAPLAADPIVEDLPGERPRRLNRRMLIGGGGAIAASIAAGVLIGYERYRTLESGVGEIRHIALAGGTSLVLDTDTRVDIAASSGDRVLELRHGKLFLDVARRQGAALLVRVGDLAMETAGGAFGVQSLAGASIAALVTRGELAVSQGRGLFGRPRSVTVGQGAALAIAPGDDLRPGDVRPVSAVEQAQLLAWRDGMLAFGGEALGDAVRAFDRYGPVRIVVADPELARQKITGLFRADDPKGFATAIAASFGGFVTGRGDVLQIAAKNLTSS